LQVSLSGGLERVRLKNEERFTDTEFDNTYNNLYARFFMRFRINQMQSISMRFSNSRNVPSLRQLQPVSNTTDPLNIVEGNTNLKPTLNNRFSLNYYSFDYKTHAGIYVFIGGTYNTDEVVGKTITDEDLVRTTTYTNVDGSYSFYSGIGAHKEYKMKDNSTLKPRLGLRSNLSKDLGFSNGEKYHANNFSVGPRVSLEYDVPDIINIEPSYNMSYNHTRYSLNNQRDQDYINHDVGLRITSYWPEDFIFGNDITYSHVGNTAPGFDND